MGLRRARLCDTTRLEPVVWALGDKLQVPSSAGAWDTKKVTWELRDGISILYNMVTWCVYFYWPVSSEEHFLFKIFSFFAFYPPFKTF